MNVKSHLLFALMLCNLLVISDAFGQPAPPCIDTNGDGYGWNGVNTCSAPGNPDAPKLTDIARASVSADGRYVVYGTTINPSYTILYFDKVWLHDRNANSTTLLNTDAAGRELVAHSPVLSRDGRFVAYYGRYNGVGGATPYYSGAQGVYIYDINSKQTTELVAPSLDVSALYSFEGKTILEISDDGSYIAYQDKYTLLSASMRVINRLTGGSALTSVDELGNPLDPVYMQEMSGNGRYVFTRSFQNMEIDSVPTQNDFLYAFDVETGITTRLLDFTNDSYGFSSSEDGRTIAFSSEDNTLVPNDTSGVFSSFLGHNYATDDVFVYELDTGLISRVSVDSNGNEASDDGASLLPQISADGRYVSFESFTNLDNSAYSTDCLNLGCEFIHDRETRTTSRVVGFSGLVISDNGTTVQYGANDQDVYSYTIPAASIVNDQLQCIDSDGDGYGWNGEDTCTPETSAPNVNTGCDYSDAALYGGWGWNAAERQSCAPLNDLVVQPEVTQCVDSNGDGYGWNGIETCDPSS